MCVCVCVCVCVQRVDYKAMKVSPLFERYCDMAVQLQRVELALLTREEKLAFFINTYNALVIHGYLRLGPPTSMWQRYRVQPPPPPSTRPVSTLYYTASSSFCTFVNQSSKSLAGSV